MIELERLLIALQSCFVRFYSAVGLPILQPERFEEILE